MNNECFLHVSYGIYLTWKLGIQTWQYDNVVFGMAPCTYWNSQVGRLTLKVRSINLKYYYLETYCEIFWINWIFSSDFTGNIDLRKIRYFATGPFNLTIVSVPSQRYQIKYNKILTLNTLNQETPSQITKYRA